MSRQLPILWIIATLFLVSSCALRVNQNLDPESREFLSKVRYIITKQEKELFLRLPPEKRLEFQEQFWKKRDPNPETEENEFKETYLKRIEEANLLFRDGNEPGWIQDRGRIYILLGPPTARETYPRGITFYGKPTEIWYYGFFPIWFVDDAWNGTYRLDPYSAQQLAEIMSTQMDLKPKIQAEKPVEELAAEIIELEGRKVLRVSIPYEQIWLESKEEKLQTVFHLAAAARDHKGKSVWDYSKDYLVEVDPKELNAYRGKNYVIEVPLSIPPGSYQLEVELRSSVGSRLAVKKTALIISK